MTLQLPKAPTAVKVGSPAAPGKRKRERSRGGKGGDQPRGNDAPGRGAAPQGRSRDGGRERPGSSDAPGRGAAEQGRGQEAGGKRRGGDRKGKGGGKGKGNPEVGEVATEERSRSAIRTTLQRQRKREENALPKKQRKRLLKKRKQKETKGQPKGSPAAAAAGKGQPPLKKKKLKASEVTDAMCKKGHTMHKRTMNPAGYMKPTSCDKCGLANLSKKCQYFYHCSFCKWDICPDCILAWRQRTTRAPKFIREKLKEEREGGDGKIAAKIKKKDDERLGKEIDAREFSKDRRQIWLPTDATSVSRAPLEQIVVSDWVEGVPL